MRARFARRLLPSLSPAPCLSVYGVVCSLNRNCFLLDCGHAGTVSVMIDSDPLLGSASPCAQRFPRQHNPRPRWAALAAAPGIRNPAVGAHRLLTCARDSVRAPPSLGRVPPVLLTGDGARRWCEKQHLATAGDETSLSVYQVTDAAKRQWEWCRTQDLYCSQQGAANAAVVGEHTPAAASTRVDGVRAASSPSPSLPGNGTYAGDTGMDSSVDATGHIRSDTVGAVVIDPSGRVAAGAQHDISTLF